MAVAKLTTGKSFSGLIDYLRQDTKQARLLGGTIYSQSIQNAIDSSIILTSNNSKEIASDLNSALDQQSLLNRSVGLVCRHTSIGFAPEDGQVSDEKKIQVAARYMELMGYSKTPWFAIDHHRDDHNHDHFHIISHAVDNHGKRVSNFNDYDQARFALDQIEKEFELTPFVRIARNLEKERPIETFMKSLTLDQEPSIAHLDQHAINLAIAIITSPQGSRVKDAYGVSLRIDGSTFVEVDHTGLITYRAPELECFVTPDIYITPTPQGIKEIQEDFSYSIS
jgi:hypothetical protein